MDTDADHEDVGRLADMNNSPEGDNDDMYEREQLEVALYSQIHFEENSEFVDIKSNDDKMFYIDVKGGDDIGFIAKETNADSILNDSINKKYGVLDALNAYRLDVQASLTPDSVKKTDKDLDKKGQSEFLVIESDDSDDDKVKSYQKEKSVKFYVKSDRDEEDVLSVSSRSSDDSLDAVLGERDSDYGDDIQMNVSVSPRYIYRKMAAEDDVADCTDNESDGDHWAVDREDSFKDVKSAVQQGRYYKPIRCHNCNQVGHLSKSCPQPQKEVICCLCSDSGHIARNCPQSVCYNCQAPGHDAKECLAPRRSQNFVCYRCNMTGHDQKQCPDVWRQYHVTTSPGRIRQQPQPTKRKRIYCYNCAEEGHYGHECEEDRMSRYVQISTPFICKYQSEREIQAMMRRYDEAEERPSKLSRTESDLNWRDKETRNSYRYSTVDLIENKIHTTSSERHREKDKNFVQAPRHEGRSETRESYRGRVAEFIDSRTYSARTEKTEDKDRSVSKPQIHESRSDTVLVGRKTSPFVHMVKKNPYEKTGRNNFDMLQFTVINKPKKTSEIDDSHGKVGLSKSQKRRLQRKKKKSDSLCVGKLPGDSQVCYGQKDDVYRLDVPVTVRSPHVDDISKTRSVRHSQSGGNTLIITAQRTPSKSLGKNEVKRNYSDASLSRCTKEALHHSLKNTKNTGVKRSYSEMNFSNSTLETLPHSKRKPGVGKSCFKSAEELFSLWSEDAEDFPRGSKSKKKECDEGWRNFGEPGLKNDTFQTDDLFSVQKIETMQYVNFNQPVLEDDIEHQVHSNEWWKKKKRRKRKKNK